MTALDEKQRATLLDRLFRRIGKLDDVSLIRLETMTRSAETGGPIAVSKPKVPSDPDQVSRRYFMTALIAGGILAASAGGAAAIALNDEDVQHWLSEQGWIPTASNASVLPAMVTPGPSLTPTLPAEVLTQLATLQNQLTTVIGQRDSLQQQVTQVNGQFSALQTTHDLLKDVVTLYQQLDSTNLDQVVTDALGALGMPVLAIETVRDALNNGVILTVKVLQAIEDQMPLLAAGLDWLEQQIAGLAVAIRALQTALKVANIGEITQGVGDFVSQLLDMLPFGAGDNVKAALQAMGNVINQLPDLLNNVSTRLIQPARTWIVSDKQGGLYGLLLHPVRDQLLLPSQQMVANAQNLNNVYNSQLAQPAQAALDQRAKIRAEITRKAGALQ